MYRSWFLFGVSLASASVLMVQLLLSRIFSVTAWYHVSFLVISIAMFGMTAGAVKVYRGDAQAQRQGLSCLASRNSFYFGLSMAFAAFVSMMVPIVDSRLEFTLIFLPTVAFLTAVPFYFAGVVVSLCLTRSPFRVSTVYGYDLLGAAAGCLAALLLMEVVDTPSALFLVCALPMLSGLCFHHAVSDRPAFDTRFLVGGAMLLVTVGSFNAIQERPIIYPLFPKGNLTPQQILDLDRWNSISRITLFSERENVKPFAWGYSTRFPETARATYRQLVIDSAAGTPLTQFDGTDFENLSYLEYDITSLAYHLPGLQRGAIIGVGGGRDVLTAKYFGVDSLTALDVNAIQIELLRDDPEFREYSGFNRLENVELIHSEARSWFSRNRSAFNIIQMSMIDTWASTSAGAFALSENGLYTVEGWRVFMDDLAEGGVFTVSRWLNRPEMPETARTLSLAVAALLERGAQNPRAHIYLAGTTLPTRNLSTLILARDPLTEAQLDALDAAAGKMAFEVMVSPRQDAPPLLRPIIDARSEAELESATSHSFLKLFPPTDRQPFFFNQAPLDQPVELFRMARERNFRIVPGHVRASLNLFFVILFSAVMVALVILLPLRRSVESIDGATFVGGTAYFFLIGMGFMFLEISLLQTMSPFLGHPSLSLAVVLFSLILATGIGSLMSGRLPLNGRGRIAGWALLTAAYFLIMGLTIHKIFLVSAELTLALRALVCLALTVPGGILLGFGFPTGMHLCQQRNGRVTPWLWGVNGAAGVLGSAVAIATNIGFGLDKTMMLGAAFYALLLPAALILSRSRAAEDRVGATRTALSAS